jgi:nicotinamidase-related amidase
MEESNLTAREYYEQIKANPARARFGFGRKAALLNIDLQKAYTCVGEFKTAYETNPKQIDFINDISALARSRGLPVIWTHVAYLDSAEDAGVWGTRTDTPDSLQNIKIGSRRAEFDDRLDIDRERDVIYNKRMPSVFHETSLQSLLVWHRVDTLILTGGSTSGCVRATCVDSLKSRTTRTSATCC